MLAPDNQIMKDYPPTKLHQPFTTEEITQAARRMKNGSSPGCDDINGEYIKYAPAEIHKYIADTLNRTFETGEPIEELQLGILTPLQKPGKKKGPPENIRPIILLSVIRKVFTICMIKRIWDRISDAIPTEQSAYQPGRGTTEHVFAVKMIAEKAITSNDYTAFLLLLDMSKAFDTVDRELLFNHLEKILEPDELHIMSRLTNHPQIKVRVGTEHAQQFESTIGIMQGDCLSAILFIYYLARCLDELKKEDDIQPDVFYIAPKYADDITIVTTSKEMISKIKETIPPQLKKYNLMVNETKTEQYQIPRPHPDPLPLDLNSALDQNDIRWSALDWITNAKQPTPVNKDWKKCKLLGSLLDASADITRRKMIALEHMKTFKNIFNSHKLKTVTKVRTFNTYVATIFLYNSETWTITQTLENQIDSCHRRLLREAIGVHYPKIITNEEIYRVTKAKPWSRVIKRRRLRWLGHVMRLEDDTPAKQALQEFLRPVKKPRGRPTTTWLKKISSDLSETNIQLNPQNVTPQQIFENLKTKTSDRNQWRKQIRVVMDDNHPNVHLGSPE